MSRPGRSISDLMTLINPKPTWEIMLVVGDDMSLAYALASKVRQVNLISTYLTSAQTTEESTLNSHASKLIDRCTCTDGLFHAEKCFDFVFCYQCSQTLPDIAKWLQHARLLLKPQGLLGLTTHFVPGTRLRGKTAGKLREAGEYINAWHRLRNPQHKQFYSQNQWEDTLLASGYVIEKQEIMDVFLDLDFWTDAVHPDGKNRLRLKAMLIQAPEKAHEFLTPQFSGDRIRFRLPEITILATSNANND